jgi:hypothetical protein
MSIEIGEGIRGKWFWNGEALVETEPETRPYVHNVSQDTIEPTWHPHDGRFYDSKSAFRRVTKAAGGVEVSTADWQRVGDPEPIKIESCREDMEKAWYAIDAARRGNRDYINNIELYHEDRENLTIDDIDKL